jgi:DNA-binding MarR family transcriptional regulator
MSADQVDVMVAQWAEREPDLDVSALEVVGRLLLGAEKLQRALVAALRPLGLSYGDFDVLNTLRRRNDPRGTNPRDLAESALITSGAMTARLDRLDRAGLVERHLDDTDRRQVLVRLTDKGDRLAAEALRAVLAADAEFLAPLPEPERRSLAKTLRRLL